MDSNANNYNNDANIELAWAIKAYEDAELHYNVISSVDPTLLKLSKHDDRIYEQFRLTFPNLDVSCIVEDELKSKSAKEKWREFCNKFEDVENFNYGSLLRLNPLLDYNENNTVFDLEKAFDRVSRRIVEWFINKMGWEDATRIQFLAIEIARNKEGWNKKLYDKCKAERKQNIATALNDNLEINEENDFAS